MYQLFVRNIVKPLRVRVHGPMNPVIVGQSVTLNCIVDGARPPVTISWLNNSIAIQNQPLSSHDLTSDETYRSVYFSFFVLELDRIILCGSPRVIFSS